MRLFIYCLRDPVSMEVRYVGCTSRLRLRRYQHRCAKTHRAAPVQHWTSDHAKRGTPVIMELLGRSRDGSDEMAWIQYFASLGCDMLNWEERGTNEVFRVYFNNGGHLDIMAGSEAQAEITARCEAESLGVHGVTPVFAEKEFSDSLELPRYTP